MDKNRILSVLLLILVMLTASDASTRFLNEKVSPSPAPDYSPSNKELNKNTQAKAIGPPPDSHSNGPSKSEVIKKMNDGKQASEGPNGDRFQLEKCDGSLQKCHVEDLVACLRHPGIAKSKEWVVVVQNVGDYTLKVNISVPASVRADAKMLELAKHGTQKVSISTGASNTLNIVLNAGKGDCNLKIGTLPSLSDWIQQFPVYAKQFTPMYGYTILFFTLFIAGVIWGCCKFSRRGRRPGDRIRYQQLEMEAQVQSNTENVEAGMANGWEENWDDEWDEKEARTSPSTATNIDGNVSSNGHTSRSTDKKNDWDIEWDD